MESFREYQGRVKTGAPGNRGFQVILLDVELPFTLLPSVLRWPEAGTQGLLGTDT